METRENKAAMLEKVNSELEAQGRETGLFQAHVNGVRWGQLWWRGGKKLARRV